MFDEGCRNHIQKTGSDISFGLVFVLVFLVIGLWPLIGDWANFTGIRIWAVGIALALLVVSFAIPRLLAPANGLWIRFGFLLGRIMNPIIMGVLFFIVLSPVAVVMRLSGKDILSLKQNRGAKTYWIVRNDEEPPSMSNQF